MKHIYRFKTFTKTIGKGLHIEFKETIAIPSLLMKKEYKKAGYQVVDLFKMSGLAIVWIIPGGAVITAMILKFSHKTRPSAFQPNEEELDTPLSEIDKKEHLERI